MRLRVNVVSIYEIKAIAKGMPHENPFMLQHDLKPCLVRYGVEITALQITLNHAETVFHVPAFFTKLYKEI